MNIAPHQPSRILVVCLGNHCQSPLAAAVLARHSPDGTHIRSAGLAGKHAGKPAHPAMIAAAARLGYDLTSHRGTHVSCQLLDWAQLVLAMDTTILTALRELTCDRSHPELRLYLGEQDVPDPWGKGQDAFDVCAALIETGAWQLTGLPR
jgi:protein-tyrosine phosphatase